jgi:hydrogenase maturation factor
MNDLPSPVLFEARVLVVRNSEDGITGIVHFQGVRIPVNLSFLPKVRSGDLVLIEGRVALSRVREGGGNEIH